MTWIDRVGWAVTRRLYRWGERWATRHGRLPEFRQTVGWLPDGDEPDADARAVTHNRSG